MLHVSGQDVPEGKRRKITHHDASASQPINPESSHNQQASSGLSHSEPPVFEPSSFTMFTSDHSPPEPSFSDYSSSEAPTSPPDDSPPDPSSSDYSCSEAPTSPLDDSPPDPSSSDYSSSEAPTSPPEPSISGESHQGKTHFTYKPNGVVIVSL